MPKNSGQALLNTLFQHLRFFHLLFRVPELEWQNIRFAPSLSGSKALCLYPITFLKP